MLKLSKEAVKSAIKSKLDIGYFNTDITNNSLQSIFNNLEFFINNQIENAFNELIDNIYSGEEFERDMLGDETSKVK